jgi:hypothetical protein
VNPRLRQQLETLHNELRQADPVDSESRALLVTLLSDITRLLEKSGTPSDEDRSVTERLNELAVQFEAEHPALGTAIRQVVDTLAKAGI